MIFLCLALAFLLICTVIKIIIMKKSVTDISRQLNEKINEDTNTPILVSSDKGLKGLADQLNIQLAELNKLKHSYFKGDAELKEAVTNISHDIRTPLTAISGYLELLKKEEHPSHVKKWLEIISERTDAIKTLTDEMLKYAVSVTEKQDIILEDVVLNDVIEETVLTYYGAITEKGITPEIEICSHKIHRSLNRNALGRIFGNIISNALKYSDGDLNISLHENGEIIFSNHSRELDEIKVHQLFQRFYTVENAAKSTGLGLTITKALTEQMGGTINAEYIQDQLFITIEF